MILELGYQILYNINKKMKIFPSAILSSLILHFNNGGIERGGHSLIIH